MAEGAPSPPGEPGEGSKTFWSDWGPPLAFLAAGLLLRFGYIFHYRFDSDEPQHLHVAWGWAHGLMQYREVFDNHTPLFHLLSAPLVAWWGERPDLLILMRLAMLPVYGLILWLTYRIGKDLFSAPVGRWAAVITGLLAPFFLTSIEYRTDDLWALLWLAAVAVFVGGRMTPLRGFFVGLILGAAASVSLKTSMLLGCSLGAGLLTVVLCHRTHPWGASLKRYGVSLAWGILGLLAIPTMLALWFYSQGALRDLYYGAIQHNLLPGLIKQTSYPWRRILFVPALIIIFMLARNLMVKRNPPGTLTAQRAFIFLLAGIYFAAARTLWPLFRPAHLLPIWPLMVVYLIPLLDRPLPDWPMLGRGKKVMPSIAKAGGLFFLVALLLLSSLVLAAPVLWSDHPQKDIKMWKAVLSLTDPGDYVMDPKGQLIFRRRAFYWGFETVTNRRFERGLIPDTIPEELIKTKTQVVYPDLNHFPPQGREFINANYVFVEPLLVAGKFLSPDLRAPTKPIYFQVQIPASYVLIGSQGPAGGQLDGLPCQGARFIGAGGHEYRPAPGEGRLALVLARAARQGFLPFAGSYRP